MDMIQFGRYLKALRQQQGLTQKQLADHLQVSFQAVSKWERGQSLPDTTILLDLADTLHTSVDILLNGGKIVMDKRQYLSVENVYKGFEAMESVKDFFGSSSDFYKGMVEGINAKMNIDLEAYLSDAKTREVMVTEVLIQHLMQGGAINLDEARQYIKNPKMLDHLERYQKQYASEA